MHFDQIAWLSVYTPHGAPYYEPYSWLIQSTIYLSVTAVCILLFKMIFRNRLKARWHFLIWAILLIRFLVPILPSSPVSVFNTVKVDESMIEQSSYQAYETPPNDEADHPSDVDDSTDTSVEAVKEHGSGSSVTTVRGKDLHIINISEIVVVTWLGGAVLLFLYFVIVYAVYIHRLKKRRSACGDNIHAILDSCKEQLGIKRKVRIYHADTTPTLIGLFRPTVYLPEPYSEAELRNVLLHELCHMKHMDVLWSLLAVLILCMNWFNPIMWVCFFLFKRDIEVYCDERTLRYAEDKQSYALLLLKTATARKERFVLGTTSLQSGKADVKRRIRFMAKFKKPSVALVLIAVVLVGAMTTACLTNPTISDFTEDISVGKKENTELPYKSIGNNQQEMLFLENGFSNADRRTKIALDNKYALDSKNTKEYIYDRMMNSIDYFDTLRGTYSYSENGQPTEYISYAIDKRNEKMRAASLCCKEDNDQLVGQTYYGQFDYYTIGGMEGFLYVESENSIADSMRAAMENGVAGILGVCMQNSRITIACPNYETFLNTDYVSLIASNRRYSFKIEEQCEGKSLLRENPCRVSGNEQYFPQPIVYMHDYDSWQITDIDTLFGRECYHISGKIDEEASDSSIFDMQVDILTGALLQLRVDSNKGKTLCQMTTNSFVVNEDYNLDYFAYS